MNDFRDSSLDRQLRDGGRQQTSTLSAWDIARFEVEHFLIAPTRAEASAMNTIFWNSWREGAEAVTR